MTSPHSARRTPAALEDGFLNTAQQKKEKSPKQRKSRVVRFDQIVAYCETSILYEKYEVER
jgi:hypothetical protein